MPSKHTTNYQLSQWEVSDRVHHEDFNEDNRKIDEAIKAVDLRVDGKADASALSSLQSAVDAKASQSDLDALKTTVSQKAEQSALTSLKTTVSGKGNCQIVSGSYTGNGKYGSSNPNSLSFGKKPWFVLICGPKLAIMARDHASGFIQQNGSNVFFYTSWTATGVSWYTTSSDDGAPRQLNESGKKYYYIAFVEA